MGCGEAGGGEEEANVSSSKGPPLTRVRSEAIVTKRAACACGFACAWGFMAVVRDFVAERARRLNVA